MFIEHQISILEWFLKDNLTVKTGELAAQNLFKFENTLQEKTLVLNCNNISQYLFYYVFDQINAALVSIRHFLH